MKSSEYFRSIGESRADAPFVAGYVYLPPGSLTDVNQTQDYPIHTFFWFFEARKDPQNAPLSVWLNGGPGSSSMLGLLVENGPCFVNHDSNSTYLNEWSWNNEVNMLYIDQPVQVGFSYDTLQNVALDLLSGDFSFLNQSDPVPEQNASLLVGTYPSQNPNDTTYGTLNGARALWHFAQSWFQEFPAYCPNDSSISIATESYGGRYGPAYTAFFEQQNQKIENGTFAGADGDTYILHLDTLILINACIDRQTQWPSYPHIAYNNTYGIQAVNETIFNQMNDALYRPGGCRDQVNYCIGNSTLYDPTQRGFNTTVNKICQAAETFCSNQVRGPYLDYSGRNYYDFGTLDPDPNPPPWYIGYLNQPHVQAALGTPVNWTQSSNTVAADFQSIGDYPRPGWLEDLGYLLENGIKVVMAFGDRDYACNWIGGEAVSLAIPYSHTKDFNAAGYTDLIVNDTYSGGKTRQYGNLSFSRVYESGHEVPYYQPETAYQIFNRALFNKDIATGMVDTAANASYSTEGPSDSWATKNIPPAQPLQVCYSLDTEDTCTTDQEDAIANGTAVLRDWIYEDANSTLLYPDSFGSG